MSDFILGAISGVLGFVLLIGILASLTKSTCESRHLGAYRQGKSEDHNKIVRCERKDGHTGRHWADWHGVAWTWTNAEEIPS